MSESKHQKNKRSSQQVRAQKYIKASWADQLHPAESGIKFSQVDTCYAIAASDIPQVIEQMAPVLYSEEHGGLEGCNWEDLLVECQDQYRDSARAVLKAIRIPTPRKGKASHE